MMDSYFRTKAILRELGIYSFYDYQSRVALWEKVKNRPRGGQAKIDALRQIVVDDFMDFKEQDLTGQYISINPHHQEIQLENYMCLFPKRTLIETETLMSYRKSKNSFKYDAPPNDYFEQFFKYEKLIKGNIVQLYPINTGITRGEVQPTFDDVLEYSPVAPFGLNHYAWVYKAGSFSRVAHQADHFYIALPWLYEANTNIYLDICASHPAEFDNLAITIEKISRASNSGEDFNAKILLDLQEALTNIQIAFERKQARLRAKGIVTILGIVLTFIPFTISHFLQNFNPELFSGIIGTTSIVESSHLLNEFVELKNAGISEPFWVVWKWKNKI